MGDRKGMEGAEQRDGNGRKMEAGKKISETAETGTRKDYGKLRL